MSVDCRLRFKFSFSNHNFKSKWPFSYSFGSIVSSDVECSFFKPVHSVIIEIRQTKFSIWRMDTGDRKLVCDRPFAHLLRICSLPGAPSPICALFSGMVKRQCVGGLV